MKSDMKIGMKLTKRNYCVARNGARRAVFCALVLCLCQGLWAAGRQAQIESAAASGGEVWQHEYDVTEKKSGKYNVIVTAKDHAGNVAVSGPFNLSIDPNAGLPAARVVYPDNGTVIRQDLKLIGVASGRFGVSRVTVRLDDGLPRQVHGTDYWDFLIGSSELSEGNHTLYTQAFDSKGASGPELASGFIVDKGPPALELLSHKIGDLISGNITVRGMADDPNGIRSVSLSRGDDTAFTPLSVKRKRGETGGEFSFAIKTRDLSDGPAMYYLRAVDATGYISVKPYLFFVDNNAPELEIFTPDAASDVYGKFTLSGSIRDTVGLEKFYYEWGGTVADIPIRPGDPFWSVDLEITADTRNAGTIKVSALDKSGNLTSVTRKLQDRRKIKVPTLVIDYPPPGQLGTVTQDMSIYGHIETGFEGAAVTVEGIAEEFPARPAFRISSDLIPQGRSSLKLYPRSSDGISGAPVTLRINKPAPVPAADGTLPRTEFSLSPLEVSSPAKDAWFNTPSVTLEGRVTADAAQLQYRFNPADEWKNLSVGEGGNFSAAVSTVQLPEGHVHLELRTVRGGAPDLPVYHPFNRASSVPEINFIAPTVSSGAIHGNVTVLGSVRGTVPVREIAYSLNGSDFNPLPFTSKYGQAWFNYFCNFNDLAANNKRLIARVTDVSGGVFDKALSVVFDPANDAPTLILNSPESEEVFTTDFAITGVAFDDDRIAAVYWRVLGPSLESIPPGQAGESAREAARAFAANGDTSFKRLATEQNFEIAIPFTSVTDGEYTVEVYAEDIYGVSSEIASRAIRISTDAPKTEILSPLITEYNRKAVRINGISGDANGIARVFVSMDNGNTWQRTQINENDEWSLNINTVSYKDGIYSALIRAEDNYGVASFTTAMINIDNTPPELSINQPENGARVSNDLRIMGRVQDNVSLSTVHFQVIGAANAGNQRSFELPSDQVILQTVDMSGLPQGEYIIRGQAVDLAGNESVFSRKIIYTLDDTAAEVAIFNPMPGETHSGPLSISGIVSGAIIPARITLFVDQQPAASLDVDRYGVFHHSIPEEQLSGDTAMVISAGYDTPAGVKITSPRHSVRYAPYGPSLTIDSHRDGDMVTGRPYLSGTAGIVLPEPAEGEKPLTRAERAEFDVEQVLLSFDNGRSFSKASGGKNWKFRLETGDLPLGPLPVLVKAEFANGQNAVRRILLTVDTNAPMVATISPPENSTHRDNLVVYGSAGDDVELDSVELSLRPGDKAGYSVPQFIQGLYFDTNFLGATYVDFGLGLSFFKDNVRLQVQVGAAPDGSISDGGRFTGLVTGGKIIANVFYLPFDYFFGPDWSFYSMSIALGANFSYFAMDEGRNPLYMGAVLAQWEFINADMSQLFPKWQYLKNIALYLEPILWFASSDVNASEIFRIAIGARVNIF